MTKNKQPFAHRLEFSQGVFEGFDLSSAELRVVNHLSWNNAVAVKFATVDPTHETGRGLILAPVHDIIGVSAATLSWWLEVPLQTFLLAHRHPIRLRWKPEQISMELGSMPKAIIWVEGV